MKYIYLLKRSLDQGVKSGAFMVLLATGSVLTSGVSSAASTPALDFSSTQNWGFGAELTIGWGFNVSQQQLVSELGYYDYEQDGLVFDHDVALFRVSDNSILASGTVTTLDALDGYFRYIDIAPVLLNPGESYYIAGFDPAFCAGGANPCGPVADPHDRVANPPSGDLGFAPTIKYEGWQSESTPSLDLISYNPDMAPWANSDGPLIVANFKSTVVPVPAAVWLFGSGLLGLVGVARRRSA